MTQCVNSHPLVKAHWLACLAEEFDDKLPKVTDTANKKHAFSIKYLEDFDPCVGDCGSALRKRTLHRVTKFVGVDIELQDVGRKCQRAR